MAEELRAWQNEHARLDAELTNGVSSADFFTLHGNAKKAAAAATAAAAAEGEGGGEGGATAASCGVLRVTVRRVGAGGLGRAMLRARRLRAVAWL